MLIINLRPNHEVREKTTSKCLPIHGQAIQNERVGKPIVVHDQCSLCHNPGSKNNDTLNSMSTSTLGVRYRGT